MSDFLSELRREVVDAHAAHRVRSRPRRVAGALWRPGPLLGAAAAAVALLALLVGVRALRAPEPTGGPRVLAVVTVGGNPVDGAYLDGTLWVADFQGRALVPVDPARRRAGTRIALDGEPAAVAAGGAGLWVRTFAGGQRTTVARVDPEAGRVTGQVASGFGNALAVGPDAVWAARTEVPPEGLDRIDPRTARRTARIGVPHVYGLAASSGALWAFQGDGTLVAVDAATGEVRRRWPRVAVPGQDVENENSLAADGAGVWALASGFGVKAALVRAEGDDVRRLPVDPTALPSVTVAFGGVWIAARPEPRGPYRVLRVDPASGTVTGSVDVGLHRPVALVASGDLLSVLGGDGTVVVVDPGRD